MGLGLAWIPLANWANPTVTQLVRESRLYFLLDAAQHMTNLLVLAAVLISLWCLVPDRRGLLGLLPVGLLICGFVCHTIKHTAGRARPSYSILMSEGRRQWIEDYLAEHPDAPMSTEAVDQWVGLHPDRPQAVEGLFVFLKSGYTSFPSGHTASAFFFADYMAALYPPVRGLWFTLAFFCGLERVYDRDHHPGDVVFGAGLGMLVWRVLRAARWYFALSERIAAGIRALIDWWQRLRGRALRHRS